MVGPLRLKSKVGRKGQAVIPKPVRDQLGIRPGDEVYFREEEGRILVEKQSDKELLEGFLTAFPKRKLPKNIDWDQEHYSQFG